MRNNVFLGGLLGLAICLTVLSACNRTGTALKGVTGVINADGSGNLSWPAPPPPPPPVADPMPAPAPLSVKPVATPATLAK